MKKFKKLLVATGLLMALGLIIPVVKGNANTNDGITVCSDLPPVDSVGTVS